MRRVGVTKGDRIVGACPRRSSRVRRRFPLPLPDRPRVSLERAAPPLPAADFSGYISNCLEALVCMLAASSIGAIWSSTSPDFGVQGVLDRFSQIQPKIIFSVNAVHYNGKVRRRAAPSSAAQCRGK